MRAPKSIQHILIYYYKNIIVRPKMTLGIKEKLFENIKIRISNKFERFFRLRKWAPRVTQNTGTFFQTRF